MCRHSIHLLTHSFLDIYDRKNGPPATRFLLKDELRQVCKASGRAHAHSVCYTVRENPAMDSDNYWKTGKFPSLPCCRIGGASWPSAGTISKREMVAVSGREQDSPVLSELPAWVITLIGK